MKTATRTLNIRVCVTAPREGMVEINGDNYVAHDRGSTVTLRKFGAAEPYTVRVGPRGCWGCDCPDARYRARLCKHCTAADRFLGETF